MVFTGLVEARTPVRALERRGAGARLCLAAPGPAWSAGPGESLSVSGCCLTVAGWRDPASGAELAGPRPGADLVFDLSAETLQRTWLAEARPGREVNLERALTLASLLGGHLVAGHVDGLGTLVERSDPGDGGRRLAFEVPEGFERWLIDKGSVAVDGVSLTVVEPCGRRFDVAAIPETLARTTLGAARVGDRVHLEADAIGKWVERLARPWLRGGPPGG